MRQGARSREVRRHGGKGGKEANGVWRGGKEEVRRRQRGKEAKEARMQRT